MTYEDLKIRLEGLTKKYGIQFWADVNKDYTAIQLKRGYHILDLAYISNRTENVVNMWEGIYESLDEAVRLDIKAVIDEYSNTPVFERLYEEGVKETFKLGRSFWVLLVCAAVFMPLLVWALITPAGQDPLTTLIVLIMNVFYKIFKIPV